MSTSSIAPLSNSSQDSRPMFSVVVPTRARLPQLRACLTALAGLNYPRHQYEVIVVNDGGSVLPESELAGFREAMNLVCIDQEWAGPAAARNNGLARARGTWAVFTDDDCTMLPNWLTAYERATRENPNALIGGNVTNALTKNMCATASQLLVDYLYEYYVTTGARGPRFFTSNNMCARVDLLRAMGPFDTTFRLAAGEDRELCDRWTAAGYSLQYCAEAVVHHHHNLSLRTFTRQHLNYGRGALSFRKARVRRHAPPVGIEPLRFYSGLVAYPLTRTGPLAASGLVALLGWSQVVNALGFFLELAQLSLNVSNVGGEQNLAAHERATSARNLPST